MSYQETVKVTLKLIAEGELSRINEAVKELALKPFECDVEYLTTEYSDQYIYVGDKIKGKFYEIVDLNSFDDSQYFHVLSQDENTVEIITSFYNGGACLSEMIEENLK